MTDTAELVQQIRSYCYCADLAGGTCQHCSVADALEREKRRADEADAQRKALIHMCEKQQSRLDAIAPLAKFGAKCLEATRESLADLDGGWLQDTAVECGCLETFTATEPCGEDCECGAVSDFPLECYRIPASVALILSGERKEGET